MNRRQKRQLEKQMGITKHKQSMSMEKRVKMMGENVRDTQEKRKETDRRVTQERIDRENSEKVATLATTLMVTEGLSYIDALEKAREQVV